MVHDLSKTPSLANQFLLELRHVDIQGDPIRFRKNLIRLGQIFAYEISKQLTYETVTVPTPMGEAQAEVIQPNIVLGVILRAGLPLHQGLLEFFDGAENAFISAYRKHHKDGSFEIRIEYTSCPSLEDKILIMADPMLATGASMVKAVQSLQVHGQPREVHIASVISAEAGLAHVRRQLPNATIWTGAIDEELTAKSYIVPGLGDAGDLAYGAKLQE